MGDTSWLDMVPGARAAYNYIVGKISEFNVLGLQKIPAQQAALNALGQRVNDSRDSNLMALYKLTQTETDQLKSNWLSVEEKVRGFLGQLKSIGLGIVPVATLALLAGTAVVVSGAMFLFFKRAENHDQMVQDFANSALERGLITAEEASRLVHGSGGGMFDSLGQGLTTLALVVGAIYLLPRLRRGAR